MRQNIFRFHGAQDLQWSLAHITNVSGLEHWLFARALGGRTTQTQVLAPSRSPHTPRNTQASLSDASDGKDHQKHNDLFHDKNTNQHTFALHEAESSLDSQAHSGIFESI